MPYRAFLVVCALILAASVALAAENPAPEPVRIRAVTDTLHVIGERVGADPLGAAMATTVLPAESWQDARTIGLDEPLGCVPGVIAQSRTGSSDIRITSRGFGARGAGERSNAGTTRGIRITLDGFPLTEPDGRTSLDLADAGLLERIRVIRSNSSTLFGPASGGLIDLQTTGGFARPFSELRAEFGGYGYARQIAELGLVAGSARVRVAASTGTYAGFREHGNGSQSTLLTSIVSEPSPATTLGVFLAMTHNVQHQAGALTPAEFAADPAQADPTYVAQDARRDNRIGRLGVKLDRSFASGHALKLGVFVEPKTLHRAERNRYRDFQRVHAGGSALLSGSLAAERVRWTVGADEALQDGSVLFYNLVDGQRGTTLVSDQREGINTLGLFAECAVAPAPAWLVTAGARWDEVHYVSEDHQEPALDASRSLDHVSPRLSLAYRPDGDRLIYAALSGGIEAPAFNEIDPPAPFDTQTSLNPFLEPSSSLTFELGTRGRRECGCTLDHVAYDVALYTLDVRNDIIPWDGGAYYRTAGKSRRSGLELGLTAAWSGGLSVRLAGTFSRNRYVDYETGAPGEGGDLVTVRYDDNETAGIPATAIRGALRYEHPRGPHAELALQRVGEYWANDANTDRVAGSTLLDLTVGTRLRLAGLDARAFVSGRNLTDEKYAASVYINGINGRYLEPGMPRNVLVGVSLRPRS